MLSFVRVTLIALMFVIMLSMDFQRSGQVGVWARSVVKRAIPQLMDYDRSIYEQQAPQQRQYRTHIVKINSKKQRSNEPALGDVPKFQGIGEDHNSFGGPKYAAQYYPLMTDQGDQAKSSNFSFGNLLSGLALWNLANEFNMYSSQDTHQESSSRQLDTTNNGPVLKSDNVKSS